MASTSSSMASSSPHQTRFDVFLSFRGADTRHSFIDHLYAALKRAAIYTFRDDDEIRRGQELAPELVKAIESSRASIVVLSENYAKSRWCLEELSLILEQRRKGNHFVLPVFYHVNPSDVRKQTHNFAIEGRSTWTLENINRWKSALSEVGNLTGMVASSFEEKFITKIVQKIDEELDLKLISTPAHLTGMKARAEEINSWIKEEHSKTNVQAIFGMGGIGKTTLAQYIYNSNKHNFECSSFLEEIGKYHKDISGMLGRQKQLLTDIVGDINKTISCVAEGTAKINDVLRRKKVLIVLDDIDERDELDALLGTSVFHPQTKIIITTRLLDIDSWFESRSWKCRMHELKLLNDHESLEVLSCHAFGYKHPPEGFCNLAKELAQYCGGNPLALKVLGSSLFVSAEDQRGENCIKDIWKSRLNSLSSLKGDLDCNIQGVLQKSFDSLPVRSCKDLFLHIAIFFVGEDEDYVVKILEDDWHARAGIMTLINKCLLTISPKKKVMVHQLLQDMGRSIIRKESRDPANATRVWCSDEAYRLLIKGDGSETIEGLTLDMRKLKEGTEPLAIKTGSLVRMHNLKLLQMKYVKLNGRYKNFPRLRWLCWHGCHLRRIPSGLLNSNALVAIDMTSGNLQTFEPPMVLNALKILNFDSCSKLVSICKLDKLPNLETLILWSCLNLTHVCKTIQDLKNLAILNLAGCKKLWKESENKPLFTLPQSVKFLFLSFCNLKNENDLRALFNGPPHGLSLSGNLFGSIPDYIDLSMIRVLNLKYCENLKSIPRLPSTIEELYIIECKSLERVTFQSTCFRIQQFDCRDCFKLSEVEGLFKLVAIKELDEADLGHMKWIKAYQDHTLNLVCDWNTCGRIQHIQMLYEYGIKSTYLQGITDQSMPTPEYMSSSSFLSFCVTLHPKKLKSRGLNVSCVYRLSRSVENTRLCLFIKINNITKGVTWFYNPMVYCIPIVDEDALWLSYWPIGNTLDIDDEVHVSIGVEEVVTISECGVSIVYINDDDIQQEENRENNTLMMEEMIDGALSEFKAEHTGVYYLSRRDFFKWSTPEVIKNWVGDSNPCTGWRKSYQSRDSNESCTSMHLYHVQELHKDTLFKRIWVGYFNMEYDISNIKKAVSEIPGVDFVCATKTSVYTDKKNLFVIGRVDCELVKTRVTEFENTVRIVYVNYDVHRLFRLYFKHIKGRISEKLHSLIVKVATRRKPQYLDVGNP